MAEFSVLAKRFIERHVSSVWQLDLLLLVKNSGRAVTLPEVSRSLYIEPRVLEPVVKRFLESGILQSKDEAFVYEPNSESLRTAIDETERMYRERRTALINLIYAPPLQHFADAFKFCIEDGDTDHKES